MAGWSLTHRDPRCPWNPYPSAYRCSRIGRLVTVILFALSAVAALADDSLITPDFKLHDPDPTLLRRTSRLDSDTLGNFYAIWREGINEGVGPDGRVVITKIRYDGTVEKAFVTVVCDSTPGFGGATDISVAASGDRFAVAYSRFFEDHQEPGATAAALPPREHSIIQLFDSSGTSLTPELWADSASPDDLALNRAVALTPSAMAAMWRESGASGRQFIQSFDSLGQRTGTEGVYDSCETMTCLFSQDSRSDSYQKGFVIAWDESVLELGASEQHPVCRIFDSAGSPKTPVMPAGHEVGYVADCGPSTPGYQSGYAPDVAVSDDGDFMLVWSSCAGQYLDPWGAKPWGQIYHADGTPRTGLILLADQAPGYVPYVHVAWGGDGNFYAAWADSRTCTPCFNPKNLFVQRIAPDGTLLGPNYIVNDVLDGLREGFLVDVAISRGRACIIWQDKRDYLLYGDGEMYAQIVSLDLIGHYVHGDVNLDYNFSSADVIYLVNYVFKSGPRPLPGVDYGDVTGDCLTTASDIIYYVNFVFKGGSGFEDSCGS